MAMLERLLAPALWPWLRWRSRPGLVHATLAGLPFETAAAPTLPKVRIAVVQLNIELAAGAQAFVQRAYDAVRQAVRAGASLVILPEYTSLPLLGLLPGVQRLASSLATAEQAAPATEEPAGNTYDIMGLAFRLAAPAARRVYLETMAALAARFRVTLLAGSLIELGSDRRLRNVAYLFGRMGAFRPAR